MRNAGENSSERLGRVYLIGAGPGDPGLITVRGLECLRAADVVIYDYLANPALLAMTRPDAALVYAGKRGGVHALRQTEINRLLVEHARAGRTVARLKGGDPFVFGRGGEEAEVLNAAGVPWEVVPGISAAIAVPAYAGIPATHRDHAASFAVVTGHEHPDKAKDAVNWGKLATGADTLLILMGVTYLEPIVEQLLAHGRASETPAAIVRWGTVRRQSVVAGTLGAIVEQARAARVTPPAMLVVGDVVSLRDSLRWFDTGLLAGYRVLLTGEGAGSPALAACLEESGADVLVLPAREDVSGGAPACARMVASADWIALLGADAVTELRRVLAEQNEDWRSLAGVRLAALDRAAEVALLTWGLRPDATPDTAGEEGREWISGLGDRAQVVIFGSSMAAAALASNIAERGGTARLPPARATLPPGMSERRLLLEEPPDALLVTSVSGWQRIVRALTDLGVIDLAQYFAHAAAFAGSAEVAGACAASGIEATVLPPGGDAVAAMSAVLTSRQAQVEVSASPSGAARTHDSA